MNEQFPTAISLPQIHGGFSIETTLALLTANGDVISDFDLTLRIAYNWHGHWYVETARTADDVVIDKNDVIMWAVIRRAVCSEQTQNWISRKVENHMQEAE